MAGDLSQPTKALLWQLYRHLRGVLRNRAVTTIVGDRNIKGAIKALEDLLNVRPETRVGE